MTAAPLRTLLANRRPLILDGAMGTELQRRGVDTTLPLWSARALIDAQDAVLQIHREYLAAGADIITTNTFRTTSRTFDRAGLPDRSAELTRRAVDLARTACGAVSDRTVLIAGSLAPLEDCYRPDRVPPDHELAAEHREQASRLAEAGVDFLLLETFGTIREARAACTAAVATDKEVVLSLLCTPDGRLYSGEQLDDAVAAVLPLRPAGLAVNCVSARHIAVAFETLRTTFLGRTGLLDVPDTSGSFPLGVYANAGVAGEEQNESMVRDVNPEEYAAFARQWIRAGAAIVGGCCGTTPDYIRRLT